MRMVGKLNMCHFRSAFARSMQVTLQIDCLSERQSQSIYGMLIFEQEYNFLGDVFRLVSIYSRLSRSYGNLISFSNSQVST